MKTRISRYVLLIFLVPLLICGNLNAATRVALVADKAFDLHKSPLVSLLEVELSRKKGIELLERGEIDKILREQEISAAGLAQRDKAVKVGRLLRVDAFVLLSAEKVEDEKKKESKLLRVRLVETAHGLRLLDSFESLNRTKLDDAAKRIVGKVVAIAGKLTLPAGEVIPVGIVDIHRVELGERYQLLARALPRMLSARLNKEPRIIMLEREDLKLLHDEKLLTQGKDVEFWSSGVLIDGYLQKKGIKDIQLKLRLRRAGGKEIAAVTVPIEPKKPNVAIDNASTDIIRKLLDAPPAASWEPAEEAEEFFRQGKVLTKYSRRQQAARLFEIAYALQPDNLDYTWILLNNEWRMRWWRGNGFSEEGTGVQYYSDLELADIVSLVVRKLRDRYNNGTVSAKELLDSYGEPLAFGNFLSGYFITSDSTSTKKIRDINRENRQIFFEITEKAVAENHYKRKPKSKLYHLQILRCLAWSSSDVPEKAMSNLTKMIKPFIMPPDMGGLIQSADERYLFCWRHGDVFELPSHRGSHFEDDRERLEELRREYLEELTNCKDPLVKFKACLALGEHDKALRVLQKELKTPDEPYCDNLKARIRNDMKTSLKRVATTNENKWIDIMESFYKPLIKNKDAHNFLLWHPGYPFSIRGYIGKWWYYGSDIDFKSSSAARRYIQLLRNIHRVLKNNGNDKRTRQCITCIEDQIARIIQGFSTLKEAATRSGHVRVKLLLIKKDLPDNLVITGGRLNGAMLWIGLRDMPKRIGVAAVDLQQKRLVGLCQAIVPKFWNPRLEMAICENAIYLSIEGLGLVEFPKSFIKGQQFLKNPSILTEKDGLPSLSITGMAGDGNKLWIGYGGLWRESGVGLYDPQTGEWETVLSSNLRIRSEIFRKMGYPCDLGKLTIAPPDKLFIGPVFCSHVKGLWKINTKTRDMKQVWTDIPTCDAPVNSDGKLLFKGSYALVQFDPATEKTKFILGNQHWLSKSKKLGWETDLFVPQSSMKKFEFGYGMTGAIDLSGCAVHGDKLWARLGQSKLIVIQRGKSIEEAEIMNNDILNGGKAFSFFSTPYGLIAIGEGTVGLIEIKGTEK